MTPTKDLPILPFASALLFGQWLCEHCTHPDGVWIKVARRASGVASVTYDEAVDMALCFGWIDGQRKSHDDRFFLQKFSPRRPKSLWSKRNITKIAELTAAGRMQPSGLAEVEAAKQDGRWAAAYDSPRDMVVPEDFLEALGGNTQAQSFFIRSANPTCTPLHGGWRLPKRQRQGSVGLTFCWQCWGQANFGSRLVSSRGR